MTKEQVTKGKVERLLNQARCEFLDREHFLLRATVNERSLTHRFAVYLEEALLKERETYR